MFSFQKKDIGGLHHTTLIQFLILGIYKIKAFMPYVCGFLFDQLIYRAILILVKEYANYLKRVFRELLNRH